MLGGEGCESGGRSERSIERLDEFRFFGAGGDGRGDICIVMAAMW